MAVDGHLQLLRLMTASLDAIPLGGWTMPASIGPTAQFISAMFMMAFGVAGASILILFLIDAVIALIARTVPQMNALVLGFSGASLASSSPEIDVLVALLGGESNIKWAPGFSLLSKAAASAPQRA